MGFDKLSPNGQVRLTLATAYPIARSLSPPVRHYPLPFAMSLSKGRPHAPPPPVRPEPVEGPRSHIPTSRSP